MVSWIQALILSIVQGITEWLPISSSGHIALLENLFNIKGISFNVYLHAASIFSVIVVFYKDITALFNFREKENLRYLLLLLIALIPAGTAGFFLKNQIEKLFSSLLLMGILFMISGVMVYSTKFFKEKREKIGFADSLFIGIFQAIGILPGISRSGATISAGLFRGLKKEKLIKFSFILAIPIVLGASLVEARNLAFSRINIPILIFSFAITFFISLFAIKLLIKILRGDKFYLFGIYNFILGILVIIWSFFR